MKDFVVICEERKKKKEIWLSPMKEAERNTKRIKWQHKKRHQNDRLYSDCGPTKDGQLEYLQSPNWCG